MKNYFKIFLVLGGVVLILAGLALTRNVPTERIFQRGGEKIATQSAFSAALEEAKKKAEEAKKAEEEKKRQEEETRKFIATYGPCRNIPILMYHHVADEPGWLYVKKETFSQQMGYLATKGYTPVTLPEVVENLQTGKPLPQKPIVLTFDDGYRDFYENTYPILKVFNFKATAFVITQHVEGANYISWDQLREMVGSGLITVGNHTLSHPSLSILTEERLKDEIISAKNIIEGNLGISVNIFAYPYGGANGEAEKILKENGFVAAVTSSRGLSCAKLPYELSRIRIGNAQLSSYGL